MSVFWGADGSINQGPLSLNSFDTKDYGLDPFYPNGNYGARLPSHNVSPIQYGYVRNRDNSKIPKHSALQYTYPLGQRQQCGNSNLNRNKFVGGQQYKQPYTQINEGFSDINLMSIINKLGLPSLTDPSGGGIAIWNASDLAGRGHGKYRYLNRVEVIDEKIHSFVPVKHTANVYIWAKIPLTRDQMTKVLSMSPNFMYDQEKKLLIIRSKCLNSAIAQAALVSMYARGKLSMHQINSYDLHRKYFSAANNKKQSKLFKTTLRHFKTV